MRHDCNVIEWQASHSAPTLRPALNTQASELLDMSARDLPPIDYLRQRLRYDPETGKLYWLADPNMPAQWITRYAGREAFTTKNSGYLNGKLRGAMHKAHRVAWALHYGEWPVSELDHINHNRADNRIQNLREVNRCGNSRNLSMARNNTSGTSGVTWFARTKSWQARIKVNRVEHHLGYFKTFEEAVAARKAAEAEYGFHVNHGVEASQTVSRTST